MKASLKLRDDAKPLVRVKLPLSAWGIPFISGLSIGSAKQEVAFHIGTQFDVGPSCRLSYTPNGAASIRFKAGFGAWGSPAAAPFILAAEVSVAHQGSPSISLHLRPKMGDLSLRRDAFSPSLISSTNSRLKVLPLDATEYKRSPSPVSSEGSSVVLVRSEELDQQTDAMDVPQMPKGVNFGILEQQTDAVDVQQMPKKVNLNILDQQTDAGDEQHMPKKGNLAKASSWRLVAHTGFPLGRHAVAKVRWQVRLPLDLFSEPENLSLNRLPVLVADKLSIETCTAASPKPRGRRRTGARGGEGGELAKAASMCSSVKRQLHLLYVENMMLRQTVEELRLDLGARRRGLSSGKDEVEVLGRKDDKNSTQISGVQQQLKQQDSEVPKADVAEQLKKAILTSSKTSLHSKQ